jgi:hypothetical protein
MQFVTGTKEVQYFAASGQNDILTKHRSTSPYSQEAGFRSLTAALSTNNMENLARFYADQYLQAKALYGELFP